MTFYDIQFLFLVCNGSFDGECWIYMFIIREPNFKAVTDGKYPAIHPRLEYYQNLQITDDV